MKKIKLFVVLILLFTLVLPVNASDFEKINENVNLEDILEEIDVFSSKFPDAYIETRVIKDSESGVKIGCLVLKKVN